MIYEFINKNYKNGEPIFLTELNDQFQKDMRWEVKRMVDEGFLIRIQNGVYYRPYRTFMGDGVPSFDLYLKKKYLDNNDIQGYEIGGGFANTIGLTTQNYVTKRYRSTNATTNLRKNNWGKFTFYIYSSPVTITKENKKELQFLDLMSNIDIYSEIQGDSLSVRLKEYVKKENLDISIIKDNIQYYPDKVYKNLYKGELYEILV